MAQFLAMLLVSHITYFPLILILLPITFPFLPHLLPNALLYSCSTLYFSVNQNNILIISDSQSCLISLYTKPFKNSISSLILIVKSLILQLSNLKKNI